MKPATGLGDGRPRSDNQGMNIASRSYLIDDVDVLDTSDEGEFWPSHVDRGACCDLHAYSRPPMASNRYLVEATPSRL